MNLEFKANSILSALGIQLALVSIIHNDKFRSMKTYSTILLLVLASVSVSFSKPKPRLRHKEEFKILSTKKHILYFKVNKSFIGGLVGVYDEKKNCVEEEDLPHTHTMIYFDEVPDGVYLIKVIKDKKAIEFKYRNSWPVLRVAKRDSSSW